MSGFLSVPAENKLRAALADGAPRHSTALLDLLLKSGAASSRNAAMQLVSLGYGRGLLHRTGERGSYTYSLVGAWVRPRTHANKVGRPRSTALAEQRRDEVKATAYIGPAFGSGSLAPSIGTAFAAHADDDGEVTPCHGGQILDALRRQFESVFRGVE